MQWNQCLTEILPYLCPPGSGVFTVHAARERRNQLQQRLYHAIDAEADVAWRESLLTLSEQNGAVILGLCSDTGGGIMRGANWGPLFVRNVLYQHYPNVNVTELGDVRVNPQLLLDEYLNEDIINSCRKAMYDDINTKRAVSPLSMALEVAERFYAALPDRFLLGLGGDHSCSYPLLLSYLQHKKQQGRRAAVIHFDAHTDMMPERLGIPICFGSWTYHILPYLTAPADLVQIGIRSSGRMRMHWESTYDIRQFWAHEIQENGAEAVIAEVIAHLRRQKIDEIYITFDIDALDANEASATGTPESDGLTLSQAVLMIKALKAAFPLTGADLMEVAPFVSYRDKGDFMHEPDKTLKAAATIIAEMIG